MTTKYDWLKYQTARQKTKAIRAASAMLRSRGIEPTSTNLAPHFKNVQREGLVTHCWRYGPALPNWRTLNGRRPWPTRSNKRGGR